MSERQTTDRSRSRAPRDAGYRRSFELHLEIEALYPRVEQHAPYFRGMERVDSRLPHPPGVVGAARLDPLVCALAIKAATTKRAVLAVCELGDGDNAIVLARVLLENACLLEWLIRGEGRRRLEAYAMFTSVMNERIVATIERHRGRFVAAGADLEVSSDPFHRAIWQHVFCQGNGTPTKTDRATWDFDLLTGKGEPANVKSLFREIAGAEESFEYDVLYGALGSDVVHSGPFSLIRTQRTLGNRTTFVLRATPVEDLCTIALASSNTAMFLVLDSLAEYIGIDLRAELNQLKERSKADPYANATMATGGSESSDPEDHLG